METCPVTLNQYWKSTYSKWDRLLCERVNWPCPNQMKNIVMGWMTTMKLVYWAIENEIKPIYIIV